MVCLFTMVRVRVGVRQDKLGLESGLELGLGLGLGLGLDLGLGLGLGLELRNMFLPG